MTHALPIPGYPEPSLCGEAGDVVETVGEVTCPRCVAIAGDVEQLVQRVEALERKYGPPIHPPHPPLTLDEQLAEDRILYGMSFEECTAEGTRRRIDPTTVRMRFGDRVIDVPALLAASSSRTPKGRPALTIWIGETKPDPEQLAEALRTWGGVLPRPQTPENEAAGASDLHRPRSSDSSRKGAP
jgi:hypothetical protein